MEPSLLLRSSTWLLVATTVGGLAMAYVRFSRKVNPPSWLAMAHGFFAAAGLTLLIYASLTVGIPTLANWGLVLLLCRSRRSGNEPRLSPQRDDIAGLAGNGACPARGRRLSDVARGDFWISKIGGFTSFPAPVRSDIGDGYLMDRDVPTKCVVLRGNEIGLCHIFPR